MEIIPACPDTHSSMKIIPKCPDTAPACPDTQPSIVPTLAHCDTPLLSTGSMRLCPGYTLVIDNNDMNVRRSYQ